MVSAQRTVTARLLYFIHKHILSRRCRICFIFLCETSSPLFAVRSGIPFEGNHPQPKHCKLHISTSCCAFFLKHIGMNFSFVFLSLILVRVLYLYPSTNLLSLSLCRLVVYSDGRIVYAFFYLCCVRVYVRVYVCARAYVLVCTFIHKHEMKQLRTELQKYRKYPGAVRSRFAADSGLAQPCNDTVFSLHFRVICIDLSVT